MQCGDVGRLKDESWIFENRIGVDKKDATLFMTGKPFYMALPYI